MAKGFPLQPLLDFSQHRMDSAERALVMLKQREEFERQRLTELMDYRREYQERLRGSTGAGMAIHRLRDYQAFLSKLDQAVRQQETVVSQAHARWEQAHHRWLGERRKVKAFETLAQRHRGEENRRQEKRDQRLLDEQALKQYLYNPEHEEG